MDPKLSLLTIIVLSFSLASADDDWNLKNPATKPSPRFEHAMSYVSPDHVLLFGGSDGSYNNETWIYDLNDNTWTQKIHRHSRLPGQL
jgi:hypothetical protein